MSEERKSVIIQPQIFDECPNCPIAIKIITAWFRDNPRSQNKSVESVGLWIKCDVENETVFLRSKPLYRIARAKLMVPKGNPKGQQVLCPHFYKKENAASELSDPESHIT